MKKILLSISLFAMAIEHVAAQGPTLSLVGSSPSYTKGNINTEILTEIIQQKQEEVKKRVFRNTVIEGFNNANFTGNLKNFTTYHYLYNIMDEMTSGKNKTAITKSIIESSTEFAYVYGLALYLTQVKDQVKFGALTIDANIFKNAEREINGDKIEKPKDIKTFNLILDICYDVILNDATLQKTFKFKDDLKDKNFSTWYDSDNCYKLTSDAFTKIIADKKKDGNLDILETFGLVDKVAYKALKTDEEKSAYLLKQQEYLTKLKIGITTHLETLKTLAASLEKTIADLKQLRSQIATDGVKNSIDELLISLNDLKGSELKTRILNINTNFPILTDAQKATLTSIATAVDANYDNYKELIGFYIGLQKSSYKDFTLTKDQYYSMKYVLTQFLEFAKNQFDNHIAASVIDFMLENTIVEYKDAKSDNVKPEESASVSDKGYLYIDIESLISAVDQHYNPKTSKSSISSRVWFINPRLFFSIGINYGYFLNTNTLSKDDNGNLANLQNLYFASEKLGLKIKFFDRKYSRSFQPGEKFLYKGTERIWLRPQKQVIISDMHLIVYASGLLYNIANLKSNDNFNYAIIGSGLGVTFFNGLSTNVGFACPYTDKKFNSDNVYFNIGFDIPIIDYIATLAKKN